MVGLPKTSEQILLALDATVSAILEDGAALIKAKMGPPTSCPDIPIQMVPMEKGTVSINGKPVGKITGWHISPEPSAWLKLLTEIPVQIPIHYVTQKIVLSKSALSEALEDSEGLLTPAGMAIAHSYAFAWIGGSRDHGLEKRYPDLAGLFFDIRSDSDLAQMHAS